MGRLDDAAKRKVVELREAGLSFRKIKAVLELENIKVSAQAIYLFLKEFNGRGRQNDLTTSVDSRPAVASGSRNLGLSEQRQAGWSEQQLRNLFREAASFSSPSEASGQSGKTLSPGEPRGQASGTGVANQERQQEDKKDEDVRIVSVTSLAQNTHYGSIQTARSGAIASTFARRRYTPSPANPVLVARKRLLDKALFHRARVRDSSPQSGQQTVSLIRRDQTCFPFSEGRKVMLPQTASYNPTTTRPAHVVSRDTVYRKDFKPLTCVSQRGLHPGTNIVRQGFQQRANMLTQAAEQPPRVGIRLPVPGHSSAGSHNSGSSVRAQATASQQQLSCQQSSMDTGTVSVLQDQVKSLASEVRSIGLALRMLVEQQGRLEREQTQQTQVQKQILSTLQKLASKLDPCSLQLSTTPTVTSCPMSSASYSQSTLTHSQGNSLCSQAQSKYSEINGSALDSIEQFSLDSLSSATINGFQACNTSDSVSFTQAHTPTFTQSHTQEYSPEMLNYMQPHTDSFTGMDSKPVEMASPSTDRPFQACMSSTQSSSEPVSVQNTELTIVKVENA